MILKQHSFFYTLKYLKSLLKPDSWWRKWLCRAGLHYALLSWFLQSWFTNSCYLHSSKLLNSLKRSWVIRKCCTRIRESRSFHWTWLCIHWASDPRWRGSQTERCIRIPREPYVSGVHLQSFWFSGFELGLENLHF